MSSPKAPKTPESEKIKAQVSAQLFKEGTSIKQRVGEDYVKDVTRKTQGREAASENLENEVRKSKRPKSRKTADIAGAALTGTNSGIAGAIDSGVRQSQRHGSAASFATRAAGNAVNTLDMASNIDNDKSMNKFVARNEIIQMGLDGAAGMASEGLREYWKNKEDDEEWERMDATAHRPTSRGGKRRSIGSI